MPSVFKRLELPLFVTQRCHGQHEREKFLKLLHKKVRIEYKCKRSASTGSFKFLKERTDINKILPSKCYSSLSGKLCRSLRNDKLPSNIYKAPKIDKAIKNPEGSKGSFITKVKGRKKTVDKKGSQKKTQDRKKDLSSDSGKKRLGDNLLYKYGRNVKPANRFNVMHPMLGNDFTPSPEKYFPKGHCIEKNITKAKVPAPVIYKFFPNSSVPMSESSLRYVDRGEPTPWLYSPMLPTCSCARYSHKQYDPEIGHKLEMQKIYKYRHFPIKRRYNAKHYRPDKYLVDLNGHGFKYLFKCSRSCRIEVQQKSLHSNVVVNLAHYFNMLDAHNRKILSYYSKEDQERLFKKKKPKLTFNSEEISKIRKKFPKLTGIAFNSSQPRWKDDVLIFSIEKPKKVTGPTTAEKMKAAAKIKFKEIPQRLLARQKIISAKDYKFAMPPIRMLMKSSDIGADTGKPSQYFGGVEIRELLLDSAKKLGVNLPQYF